MGRDYDISKKSDIDRMMKDIKNEALDQAKKAINKDSHQFTCPKCKRTINIRVGTNTCPFCGQKIDLKGIK